MVELGEWAAAQMAANGVTGGTADVVADQAAWQAYVDVAQSPRPGQSKRTALLVVGLVTAAMILAGVITLVGTGGGGPESASASVVAAVTSALGDKTAGLTLSGSVDADGSTSPVSGTGVSDFTTGAMEMDLHIGGMPGGSLSEKAIYDGNVGYLNMGPLIGEVIPGKSWVSLDLSQLSQSGAKHLGLGGGSLTNDPMAALKDLTQEGNTTTDLGPSTISGTPVEGYSVKMNPKATLPSLMRQAASLAANPNLSYAVYLTKNGQLYRLSTTVSLTVDSQHVKETLAMDFSNFGQAVNISLPPTDQVGSFQQFMQIVENQGQSTTV